MSEFSFADTNMLHGRALMEKMTFNLGHIAAGGQTFWGSLARSFPRPSQESRPYGVITQLLAMKRTLARRYYCRWTSEVGQAALGVPPIVRSLLLTYYINNYPDICQNVFMSSWTRTGCWMLYLHLHRLLWLEQGKTENLQDCSPDNPGLDLPGSYKRKIQLREIGSLVENNHYWSFACWNNL